MVDHDDILETGDVKLSDIMPGVFVEDKTKTDEENLRIALGKMQEYYYTMPKPVLELIRDMAHIALCKVQGDNSKDGIYPDPFNTPFTIKHNYEDSNSNHSFYG